MYTPTPPSSPLLQQHLEEIFELWNELSNFAVHKSDDGSRHCMERLCVWLGAQYAFWVGIVRVVERAAGKKADPMSGWRIKAIHPLHSQYLEPRWIQKVVKEKVGKTDPGATNIALAATTGKFRAYTLHGGKLVADLNAFQLTDHYDLFYRQRGVCDRIWVGVPVNHDTESFFCFDRTGEGRQHFTNEDLELAAFALRGIKWFHRQLLLSHGLGVCVDPLTPVDRRVIQGLLTGASEQAIAARLNLSPGTLHQYATRIYRKFGVHGRTEFTSLWLNGSF